MCGRKVFLVQTFAKGLGSAAEGLQGDGKIVRIEEAIDGRRGGIFCGIKRGGFIGAGDVAPRRYESNPFHTDNFR
jgi:hypothetical protein